MLQTKNYIILSTDNDGTVATYTNKSKALKEAEQLSNELGQTVYVSKTNYTDEYGGSEQGDVPITHFNPSK